MKRLFVRVELFDPGTEERFPVHEGIRVSVARRDAESGRVDLDRLPLAWDEATRCFHAAASDYPTSRRHFLTVRFLRANFEKRTGRLLDHEDAGTAEGPFWAPVRVPQSDSGFDDAWRRNEFFGWRGRQKRSSATDAIVLRVPLRRIYAVGHRGAPHAYPENTLAAFRTALDQGANGIELDTCRLRDGRLAVFHDSQPTKQPPRIDRTRFEDLPYELISPTFNLTGRRARIFRVEKGRVVEAGERALAARHALDLVRRDPAEAQETYRFPPRRGARAPDDRPRDLPGLRRRGVRPPALRLLRREAPRRPLGPTAGARVRTCPGRGAAPSPGVAGAPRRGVRGHEGAAPPEARRGGGRRDALRLRVRRRRRPGALALRDGARVVVAARTRAPLPGVGAGGASRTPCAPRGA